MEAIEKNDELLSLSLASFNHSNDIERKMKKRKNDHRSVFISSEVSEVKIFRLLEERQRMLNFKHKGKGVTKEGSGLHLIHLLLVAATLIKENNVSSAVDNLMELYRYVSVRGDSGQRVSAYFSDGLTARILSQKTELFSMVMSKPTPSEDFLAFTNLYRVSPFYQFAHFTANQAILEVFEREEDRNNSALHVIDFDISHGFQWPSLIQSLSEKATASNNSLSFRLTCLAKNLEELTATKDRLVSFSKGFPNVNFEFHGFLRGSKLNLEISENETIAVNLVFHLSSLSDILNISDTLTSIHSLNPSIVVLVEREGSQNSCGVLSSYVDTLHYYAAMFDSLDDCFPTESAERLSIEKNHLGREIKDFLASEEEVKCSTFEIMETWKGRMVSHGFSGIELSSKATIQAKLLLKMGCHYHPHFEGDSNGSGFRVYERDYGRALSLGWQDRFLVTASAWRCSHSTE